MNNIIDKTDFNEKLSLVQDYISKRDNNSFSSEEMAWLIDIEERGMKLALTILLYHFVSDDEDHEITKWITNFREHILEGNYQ